MEAKYEEPTADKYVNMNKDLQTVSSVPLSEAATDHTYLEPINNPVPDDGGQRGIGRQPNVYEEIK